MEVWRQKISAVYWMEHHNTVKFMIISFVFRLICVCACKHCCGEGLLLYLYDIMLNWQKILMECFHWFTVNVLSLLPILCALYLLKCLLGERNTLTYSVKRKHDATLWTVFSSSAQSVKNPGLLSGIGRLPLCLVVWSLSNRFLVMSLCLDFSCWGTFKKFKHWFMGMLYKLETVIPTPWLWYLSLHDYISTFQHLECWNWMVSRQYTAKHELSLSVWHFNLLQWTTNSTSVQVLSTWTFLITVNEAWFSQQEKCGSWSYGLWYHDIM